MKKRCTILPPLALMMALIFAATAQAADRIAPPKSGWLNQSPPDQVKIDPGRRNAFLYVNEPLIFGLKGPAPARYEVRDYWGGLVDNGTAGEGDLHLKPQPAGWYKLYLFGRPSPAKNAERVAEYRRFYGDCVGGICFVIARDNPNFPRLPAIGKYPPPGNDDEVMRAVTAMGPQRHAADASKPEQSIKRLEREIAVDRELYLGRDPARPRALLIAFPNGTRGKLEGVKKIVEHFKNVVKYYEPRNEPNGGSKGGDFVKNEMIDFYKTVKSVDPKLRVLGPGTVCIGPMKSGLGFIGDFLKAGGGDYIDGFSFHFYNGINGDLWMGRKSLDALNDLLKQYHADKKELWQTEQGFFACVYGDYQPRLQGRWTMLEIMLFEQYGLPKEHNHLWYDVSHGFWDFPAWWENDDRGFNPALPLMRVWSEELFGASFARAYDLGPNGNALYLGSLFEGKIKRTAIFMSAGSPDDRIELDVKGPGDHLHLVSAFGVESDLAVAAGRATLKVPELPVYVELSPGQEIAPIAQDFGPNLARSDGVTITTSGTGKHPVDPKIPNDKSKLNNGVLENWYYTQKTPAQPWMDDTKTFPAWIELRFPRPTSIARVNIFAPAPWQWQGTLVDYELQYDDNGKWVTIEHVNEPLKTFNVVTPSTRTKVDSYFSDRHIFQHHFAPITTDKIRIVVNNTTWGGGATQDAAKAGGQTGPHHVMLREIEVYGK